MTDEELQNLIASNAKAIEALTNLVSDTNRRVDTMADTVSTTVRQMLDLQREANNVRRETSHAIAELFAEIRDSKADTRELQLENNRILRYLEQRN